MHHKQLTTPSYTPSLGHLFGARLSPQNMQVLILIYIYKYIYILYIHPCIPNRFALMFNSWISHTHIHQLSYCIRMMILPQSHDLISQPSPFHPQSHVVWLHFSTSNSAKSPVKSTRHVTRRNMPQLQWDGRTVKDCIKIPKISDQA